MAARRPNGDREIVMAAFLGQIGGGQIDRDALGRKGQAAGGQGGADALAAFGHGLVGKADEGEGDDAGRNLNLNIDRQRLDTQKCHR